MDYIGFSMLMLKKAITDLAALKTGAPRLYQYDLKLEEKTIKWLGDLGMKAFPLGTLCIYKFTISTFSYYLGILLDVPWIYEDVLEILTRRWRRKDIRVDSIKLALDTIDRLYTIEKYREDAIQSIEDVYKYIMRDYFSPYAYAISAFQLINIAKLSDTVELHPEIRNRVLEALKNYGEVRSEDVRYFVRIKVSRNVPNLLWIDT